MKLHRPDYVRNYIANSSIALQEENFRGSIGLFFSAIFGGSSEEWRKEGRTDYKEVAQQVTERYLTEFDSDGYIVMVNGNKNSITDKYIEYITGGNAV